MESESTTTTVPQTLIFWKSTIVFSLISGLCSFYIIYSIIRHHLKDINLRQILVLCTADFFLSFFCMALCAHNYHLGHLDSQRSFSCQFQPIITWYFMEVSIFCLSAIAINSVLVIYRSHKLKKWQEIVSYLICWLVPIITSLLPLGGMSSTTDENYGNRNDLWCSFSPQDKTQQLGNIMVYYGPCLIIIVTCYVMIFLKIKSAEFAKDLSGIIKKRKLDAIRRMFFFVLGYFIVWTPLVLCYIYEAVTGLYVPFYAEYVADNLLHIQGILNFILYGLKGSVLVDTKRVISDIVEFLTKGHVILIAKKNTNSTNAISESQDLSSSRSTSSNNFNNSAPTV